MKSRILSIGIILVVLTSLFSGCNNFPEYIASVKLSKSAASFDANGWKPFVYLTTSRDNRLQSIRFDEVNIDATTSYIEAANANKTDYKIDKDFANQLKLCAQAIIEKQSADGFTFDQNGVTTQIKGVNKPVKEYFDLLKGALASANNSFATFTDSGAQSIIANSFDKDGWKLKMDYYVVNFIAIAVVFDAVNAAGEFRSQSKLPADMLWTKNLKIAQQYFIEKQDRFVNIPINADGTTNAIPGYKGDIRPLVDLVKTIIITADNTAAPGATLSPDTTIAP